MDKWGLVGMAAGVMGEYFTRPGVTVLPGVLGFAFEPGQVKQDRKAVTQAERLAADCRQHLKPTEGGETWMNE